MAYRLKKRKSQSSAFDRIVSLVNYRERCTKELFNRLVKQEKYTIEEFNDAIKLAKDYNLVNDERYAEFYIRDKFEQYRGSYLIEKHLSSMGIKADLDIIKSMEEDKAYEYIVSHKPRSKDIYHGSLRKLISRGYPCDIAIKVTNKYIDNLL